MYVYKQRKMEFESFNGNKGPFIFSQVGLGGLVEF